MDARRLFPTTGSGASGLGVREEEGCGYNDADTDRPAEQKVIAVEAKAVEPITF